MIVIHEAVTVGRFVVVGQIKLVLGIAFRPIPDFRIHLRIVMEGRFANLRSEILFA